MAQNLGNLFIDGEDIIEDENGTHSITNAGVVLNTTDARFGSGSMEFIGNSDKLTVTDATDFSFGIGNFTIDCWVKVDLTSSYHTIYEQRGAGIDDVDIFIEGTVYGDNNLKFTSRDNGTKLAEVLTPVDSITANTWHHIAVVKYGTGLNNLKIFIDGVDQTLNWSTNMVENTSFPDIPEDVTIGYGVSTAQSLNGLMDNFRLTKGEALWTSNFNINDSDAMFYTGSTSTYVRPGTLSGLYDKVRNLRGRGKTCVRPSVTQFFKSSYPYSCLPKPEIIVNKTSGVVTYTGVGATQKITGLGFKPDLVWIKNRSSNNSNVWVDSVRGLGNELYSDSVSAAYQGNQVISFDSDGFTVTGSSGQTNASSNNYVAWAWKAEKVGVVESGSAQYPAQIEKYNERTGLSIIKYTGDGKSGRKVYHSQGAAPALIIVKRLDYVDNWYVYHKDAGGDLLLDTSDPVGQYGAYLGVENDHFKIGAGGAMNAVGSEFIAYVWSDVSETSSFGSYTGNGSTSGPAVDLGFRPSWLMIKRVGGIGNWQIINPALDNFNPNSSNLYADLSSTENISSGNDIDITDTGFTIKNSSTGMNADTETYIYVAFAEQPGASTANTQGFRSITYNGDNSANRIFDSLGFNPDMVWIKCRSNNYNNRIFNSIIGPTKFLISDNTNAEDTETGLTAFNSDGFALGTHPGYNQLGQRYVAWCWNAGEEEVYDGSGSIPVIRKTNVDRGFSVIAYTGNYTAGATIAHGLGKAPKFFIVRSLNTSTHWAVWHDALAADEALQLDLNWAKITEPEFWNNTAPTDTMITLGANNTPNKDGDRFIVYAWTDIDEYNAIGSFTATGAEQTIDVGFSPDFIMLKRIDGVSSWIIFDTSRHGINSNNVADTYLYAELSNSETSYDYLSLTPTGFKMTQTAGAFGDNGNEIIYIAFKSDDLPADNNDALYNAIAYDGESNPLEIDGFNFKPDLLWGSIRDDSDNVWLVDSIRGPGNYLLSNGTHVSNFSQNGPGQFNSDGFTFSTGSDKMFNIGSKKHIVFGWNAGGRKTYNTDGSINSVVMANQTSGFSIVSYTGVASASATVGHGLDSAPEFIIIKALDAAYPWPAYHVSNGADGYIRLNETSSFGSDTAFFSESPTDSVFTPGSHGWVNGTGVKFIAYCWTSKAGKSKIGSYTGDGTTSNTIEDMDFEPDFVMIKNASGAGDGWIMYSSRLDFHDSRSVFMQANHNGGETDHGDIRVNFNDDGFTILHSDSAINADGVTYIYMAFKHSENPNTEHVTKNGNLLLKFENNTVDATGNHTPTNNSVTFNTTNPMTGSYNAVFGGSSQYISVPDSEDWNFGSGDFTIDMWLRPNTWSDDDTICEQYVDNSNYWIVRLRSSGDLTVGCWNAGSTIINWDLWNLDWVEGEYGHLAIVRDGSIMRVYHNGILKGKQTITGSFPQLNSELRIGDGQRYSQRYDGEMNMFRITKGEALWTTTNFNMSDKSLFYADGTLKI